VPSFFVRSVENLDQGAFPGQRIEAKEIGRNGREETGNCASKIRPAANY